MNSLTIVVKCKVILKIYPLLGDDWSVIPSEIEIEGDPEKVNSLLEYYERSKGGWKVGQARIVYVQGELLSI